MTQLSSFVRVACCTGFALLLASACGGQSSRGGDGGTAGAGSSAPTAGSRAIGGSSNTAGTGSAINREACTGPATNDLDGGSCLALLFRWTHDEATGLCVPITYGGCGATKNNYESLEACQNACPGGNPDYDACETATDCMLNSVGCCGVCDSADVSARDFIAYNKQFVDQVQPCAGGNVACGPCPPGDPMTNARQFFVPNCVRGACVVEDIRQSAVTACKTAADCRLRSGTGCCEGCGTSVVAVRGDGSFENLVCGKLNLPCDPCVADPPPNAVAQCNLEGHCSVDYIVKDDETP